MALRLLRQAEPYKGAVIVTALRNFSERPLGEFRQAMVEASEAEYICFVDDDDEVPDSYVVEILNALGKDYVGWQMQMYDVGQPHKPTFHSLMYDRWWEDERGYYRDISHLNPVRRKLTVHADFRAPGYPDEDFGWADQMRGWVITENYIPDVVMYHYLRTPASTRGRMTHPPDHVPPPVSVESSNFRWHPWSSLD